MKPSSDTSPSPPNMNKDFENDESDKDYAQGGQEPVETVQEVSGETQKDNKEKKSGSKPYSPTVQCTMGVQAITKELRCSNR